jgi:hypothetical protein
MFGWLKRKTELAGIKGATEDIDRFILSLRGMSDYEVAMAVAIATHWRNAFQRDDDINLLEPWDVECRSPDFRWKLNRLLVEVQRTRKPMAVGLMIWLHTLRAAGMPELRLKGRQMWSELRRGFALVDRAAADFDAMMGTVLITDEADRIPSGLEPNHP